MRLVTFNGQEMQITTEQAEKIVASGKTNLIAITTGGRTEYVNANDIAGIYVGGKTEAEIDPGKTLETPKTSPEQAQRNREHIRRIKNQLLDKRSNEE